MGVALDSARVGAALDSTRVGAALDSARVVGATVGLGDAARGMLEYPGEPPRDDEKESRPSVRAYAGLAGVEVCARGLLPALDAAYDGFGDTERFIGGAVYGFGDAERLIGAAWVVWAV